MKINMPAHMLIAIAVAALPLCQTMTPREQEILSYPREKAVDYAQYLVADDLYTTKGNLYHRRYRDHLVGIARISSEKYKLRVMNSSIGFYHDKRDKNPNRFYLGIDFIVEPDRDTEDFKYGNMVGHLLRKHLADFLFITQSCGSVFAEKEVVGSVIGMRWEDEGRNGNFNFWIEERDAELFEAHRITLSELIERNTITNAEGQVIRLRK